MTKSRKHLIHDPSQWLTYVAEKRGANESSLLSKAMEWYVNKESYSFKKGIGMADILLSLGLDNESLVSALIYPLLQEGTISTEIIAEFFGEGSNKLLHDVLQLQSLTTFKQLDKQHSRYQLENLRKMLLAIITDVRTVLIILAERLWQLHDVKSLDSSKQKALAQETLDLYAPLANRLGIWQIKWEMEDLCLRYLQPTIYNEIAKGLAARRDEREAYVQHIIEVLSATLQKNGMSHVKISGRVKHIYSIYKKMQRKKAHLKEIYDVSALRVLVDNIDECYTVLSILQNHWPQFSEEFDDYIMHPKSNGYRSIHTVIIGPDHHYVEVQIRTHQMHQESELGVAAHWRYKEGVLQTASYESKIALLRQVMAWQKEVSNINKEHAEQPIQDIFADRIYVFTPTGEIIDLAHGSTPLDFAYHIHSEVGHRCRGAKVNGNIVPLTYKMQTGDRVEIMTGKHAHPSRDWLNPHLGYLKTAKARAKLQHWFRIKDNAENAITGRELLEKELKRAGINERIDLQAIALKLGHKSGEALLAALAAGEVRISQIIHHIKPIPVTAPLFSQESLVNTQKNISQVQIVGISNLLTHLALCCKPLPGDAIVGYVTRNRGVSVHRQDCMNMSQLSKSNLARLLEVNWGNAPGSYPADLLIRVYDRPGLLRDLTTLLAGEKMNVLGLQAQKDPHSQEVDIYLTIEIKDRDQLNRAIDLLHHISQVLEVRRRSG